MDLVRLGGFSGLRRYWFWDRDSRQLVDVVYDEGKGLWVRCVAGFRLIGQSSEGRELWTRNLSKMTRYLKDSFSQFRVSVDFSDSVSKDLAGVSGEAEELAVRSEELFSRKDEIKDSLSSLETSLHLGSDGDLDGLVENRINRLRSELESVDAELDRVLDRLEFLSVLSDEWERQGYALSVCFSVSTGFEKVERKEFRNVVSRQLEELGDRCDRSIKQKLSGENFRLQFTELDTPHQILQHFYTPLIHPEEEIANEDLQELMSLYMAFAAEDIEVEGQTRVESKASSARSVNAVFQHLQQTDSAKPSTVELSGPVIGKLTGTDMAFGVDLADQPHFYVVGSTGSGKSYTKRVLLENCLAMNYNVVSVTPRDFQAVSAFKPFDTDGTGLKGDYYLIGSDLLLDKPNDFSEFFDGASFISLREQNPDEREMFVEELFDSAARLGQTGTPVFVFLDEAHLFSDGRSAESIQRAVRETRKFGVHIVLVTQSPMDFNRKYKHIRENTIGNFFLQGEYWDYAQSYLESESDIISLGQGQSWFSGRGFSPVKLDVRKPLSRVEEVDIEDLKQLDELYDGDRPEVSEFKSDNNSTSDDRGSEVYLNDEQQQVLDAIMRYIAEEDQAPTMNKTINHSPFGSSRTRRILDELEDLNAVTVDSDVRFGNESTIYRPDI